MIERGRECVWEREEGPPRKQLPVSTRPSSLILSSPPSKARGDLVAMRPRWAGSIDPDTGTISVTNNYNIYKKIIKKTKQKFCQKRQNENNVRSNSYIHGNPGVTVTTSSSFVSSLKMRTLTWTGASVVGDPHRNAITSGHSESLAIFVGNPV